MIIDWVIFLRFLNREILRPLSSWVSARVGGKQAIDSQTTLGHSPPLEHFNISKQGVRVLDRTVRNGTPRDRIIDVYFKPEKVLCEYCDSYSCRHVHFALSIPAVQKILDRKGWKVKE